MGVGCGLPAWIDEAEQCEGGLPARGGGAASKELRFQLGKEGGNRGNVAFGKGEGAWR